MLNKLRHLFSAPILEDQETTRLASLLNNVLLTIILAISIFTPALIVITDVDDRAILVGILLPFLIVVVFSYILLRRGNLRYATYSFLTIMSLAIFGSFAASANQSIGAWMSFMIVIALTTLLLDGQAVARLLAIIILFTLVITALQINGLLTPIFNVTANPYSNWATTSMMYILTGIGLYYSANGLRQALQLAGESQEQLQTNNRELVALRDALEQRVEERTQTLGLYNSQLEAVAKVARAVAAVQELKQLLPLITEVVSTEFGFYHVGIFLVDDRREFAVLQAANSEGGKSMLQRGHRLGLATSGIVGFVAGRGQSRIALDVGADSVFFNNPDLPLTRSEIALPLIVGQHTIGVLDVQSTEKDAFDEQALSALSTVADQITIAIENARLFSQTKQALADSQAIYQQYAQSDWGRYISQLKNIGYSYDGISTAALNGPAESVRDPNALNVPIRMRGLLIGNISIRSSDAGRKLTNSELALVEAVADRAALAIENARLLSDAQRRAAKERAIADISSKVGSSIKLESIMQIAVEELGRTLPGSQVTLQFSEPESSK